MTHNKNDIKRTRNLAHHRLESDRHYMDENGHFELTAPSGGDSDLIDSDALYQIAARDASPAESAISMLGGRAAGGVDSKGQTNLVAGTDSHSECGLDGAAPTLPDALTTPLIGYENDQYLQGQQFIDRYAPIYDQLVQNQLTRSKCSADHPGALLGQYRAAFAPLAEPYLPAGQVFDGDRRIRDSATAAFFESQAGAVDARRLH